MALTGRGLSLIEFRSLKKAGGSTPAFFMVVIST